VSFLTINIIYEKPVMVAVQLPGTILGVMGKLYKREDGLGTFYGIEIDQGDYQSCLEVLHGKTINSPTQENPKV